MLGISTVEAFPMRTIGTLLFATTLVACGTSSGEVIYGLDGGILDGAVVTTNTVGSSANSSTATGSGTGGDAFVQPSPTIDSGAPTADTGSPVATGDSSTPPATTEGGTCPPASCTTDSECACVGTSGAIGCCDTVTSACFTSAASACPDQSSTADSGGGGGY